jgi:integrase
VTGSIESSYDVKVWKITKYTGTRVTTYRVRWIVGRREHREGFRSLAAADGFRSELISAHRRGELFDVESGRPASTRRVESPGVNWYEFACRYVDMKWPAISPLYRKGVAQALVTVTAEMLTEPSDEETSREIRSALLNWAFNARQRGSDDQPAQVTKLLDWVAKHCRPLSDLTQPDVLRKVLDGVAQRLDGAPAAGRTTHRKRVVLSNALSWAVELGLMTSNPIASIKWTAPKTAGAIDRRCVPNPTQAAALLAAVKVTPHSGERLFAFFACLYYAALRPEEAVNLREANLDLPPSGWGWIILAGAAPEAGKAWTDSGVQREERQLKHRAVGETRPVPAHPDLVVILREHLKRWGTDEEGRLFRGMKGGQLAAVTYTRMWERARRAALGEAEAPTSPLARRPYDLRHAAVSTWLKGGVEPAQVAEWAGHSVEVLLRIYAKILDGQREDALRRIEDILKQQQPAGGQQGEPTMRRSYRRPPRRRP